MACLVSPTTNRLPPWESEFSMSGTMFPHWTGEVSWNSSTRIVEDPVAEPEVDVGDDPPVDVAGQLAVDVVDEHDPPDALDEVQRAGEGPEDLEIGMIEAPGVEGAIAVDQDLEGFPGVPDRLERSYPRRPARAS